jgi:hypothetical protein
LACSFAVKAALLAAKQDQLSVWSKTLTLLIRRAVSSQDATEIGSGAAAAAAVLLALRIASGLSDILTSRPTNDVLKTNCSSEPASSGSSAEVRGGSRAAVFLLESSEENDARPDPPHLSHVAEIVSSCWETEFEPLAQSLRQEREAPPLDNGGDSMVDLDASVSSTAADVCSEEMRRWFTSADDTLLRLKEALDGTDSAKAPAQELPTPSVTPAMGNNALLQRLCFSASATMARSACSSRLQGEDVRGASLAREGFMGFQNCLELTPSSTLRQEDAQQQTGPPGLVRVAAVPPSGGIHPGRKRFTRDQMLALQERSPAEPCEALSILRLSANMALLILPCDLSGHA